MNSQKLEGKNIIRVALVTVLLLLVPFIAMQFTGEVNWDETDFIVMGTLLFSTGLILELVMKKFNNSTTQIIAGLIVVAVFLLIWAELAVGVFGTPWAGS